MNINRIIDAVGNIIRISFVIAILSFFVLILHPPPARDSAPPKDFKTPCAGNMLDIQKRLFRDANYDTAVTGECGVFTVGTRLKSADGDPETLICPLSLESEYYFILFNDESNGKTRKMNDIFCPTHGFLSLIVKNSEAVPDSTDEELFRITHKQKFTGESIKYVFNEMCKSRKITPPEIVLRDETNLEQNYYGKKKFKNMMTPSEDTIFFYSLSIFIISGILEIILMGGRGIWGFFRKPD